MSPHRDDRRSPGEGGGNAVDEHGDDEKNVDRVPGIEPCRADDNGLQPRADDQGPRIRKESVHERRVHLGCHCF
jgi:hypothetical protein